MQATEKFLVIDFHAESRFLLVKTLQRKYPNSVIRECDDADNAVQIARAEHLSAIVAHRTFETTGAELVRLLRAVDSRVPIVMVSGIDREDEMLAAGATKFLHYDQWLRIGTVVAEHMRETSSPFDEDGHGRVA
jgi:DNA-binding NarL/FixJ family response regulator